MRVTANTLRCIDKAGGLDNYVLYTKDKDLNSDVAIKLGDIKKVRAVANAIGKNNILVIFLLLTYFLY